MKKDLLDGEVVISVSFVLVSNVRVVVSLMNDVMSARGEENHDVVVGIGSRDLVSFNKSVSQVHKGIRL